MTMDRGTVRTRLGWPADPATHRRIRRLWQRHSIAEDRRDIDGLIATLAPNCVYEFVGTGLRWEGHAGAGQFYTELFAAFPDNRFALADIVIEVVAGTLFLIGGVLALRLVLTVERLQEDRAADLQGPRPAAGQAAR